MFQTQLPTLRLRPENMSEKREICIICSGGGHLTEALVATRGLNRELCAYITCMKPHTRGRLDDGAWDDIHDPHVSLIGYTWNLLQSIRIYLKRRPKIIITTGAGLAIPFCLIGKALGAHLIFIESGARIYAPSRTGKLLYKYADKTYVQWEPLLKFFPNAEYGGLLI